MPKTKQNPAVRVTSRKPNLKRTKGPAAAAVAQWMTLMHWT